MFHIKSISIFFLIILTVSEVNAGQDILQTNIQLEKNVYELNTLLNYIENKYDIQFAYNSDIFDNGCQLKFKQQNLELEKILQEINKICKLNYKISEGHILIFKAGKNQKFTLSGYILDSASLQPLPAATLFIAETNQSTISNDEGEYKFKLLPGEYKLHCMYMGFKTQEYNFILFNNKTYNFILAEEKQAIQEVKVTSQKKLYGDIEIGRTIETIEAKQIEELNVNNPSDILHARVNGVWATQTSGAPGDHQKIRIRVINSLFGSVEPLYIVDGVPVPTVNLRSLGIADLNIHDIDNVTVLKDASSTAIYGYMGGNGVIIIDTKKGCEKKINFMVKQGIQRFDNRYPLMNTKDFMETYNLSDEILGTDYFTLDLENRLKPKYPEYSDTLDDTDWQDVLFQLGKIKEYQLSAQGNLKSFDYYLSGNYFDHTGIVTNSSYKKYSLAANIGKVINRKLSTHINYKASHQNNTNNLDNYLGNSLIYRGINAEPAYTNTPDSFKNRANRYHLLDYNIYDPDAYTRETNIELKNKYNPQYAIDNFKRVQKTNLHSINVLAKYQVFDNLFFNASSSISFRNYIFESDVDSSYLLSDENYVILSQQYNLAYNKQINKHEFKITSGVKLYKDNINWEIDSAYDQLSEQQRANQPSEEMYLRGSMSKFGETGSVRRNINSIIAHLSYNYNKKYFISLVANYDHLIEGRNVDVTDFFPSVALNWDVSREIGLKQLKQIDYFNLYTNWGQSGNYALNGLSNDIYNKVEHAYIYQSGREGYYVNNLANHYLTHERISEYNLGAELSLFKKRAIFNIDYFFKTNSDLLVQRDIPYYYGGGSQYLNIGVMENNGMECSIDLIPLHTSNFAWHTKFGYSKNNQYIRQLADTSSLKFGELDILYPDFVIKENEQIGSIYGYKIIGELTSEDHVGIERLREIKGGIKYLNFDSSNLAIDENDKVIIGNSIPDFTWNFYNSFSYKNFELYFLIHAVIGVDKYNATKAATYIKGTNQEVRTLIEDTSRCQGSSLYYESDAFIEDASFIRFKMLTLSYSPDKKFFDQAFAKFSISFENLVTITKYSGYDPEATIYTDNNFSDNALDRGAYPVPKGMYFSISLTFE